MISGERERDSQVECDVAIIRCVRRGAHSGERQIGMEMLAVKKIVEMQSRIIGQIWSCPEKNSRET